MTRLAVLADIHGNLPALEAVIADVAGETLDQVIVAGDLINGGPFSREVLETVFDQGWVAIRGNHEMYLLEHEHPVSDAGARRRLFCSVALLQEQLGEAWRARIAVMPDELTLRFADAPPLRVLHGSPGNPFRSVTRLTSDAEVRELLAGVKERCVVSGHYHIPFLRQLEELQIVNPGPVGTPMDGRRDACYALLEGDERGWRVEHRRVAVDYSALFAEFERQDFVQRCGVEGFLIVEQFRQARTLFSPFKRWLAACRPGEAATLALAREFLAGGQLWHFMSPRYQVNRHLLEVAPPARARENAQGSQRA